jgi:hypothetical protein
MSDPVQKVLLASQRAEAQLTAEVQALNRQILLREEQTRRARALFALFQEKRYLEDVKNGRVCQPPIFYEAWNRVIGRLEQFVNGADAYALPQTYESFSNTLSARAKSQRADLLNLIG